LVRSASAGSLRLAQNCRVRDTFRDTNAEQGLRTVWPVADDLIAAASCVDARDPDGGSHTDEERGELDCDVVGPLFGEKVAAAERAPADVVGLRAPDREHVVGRSQS
jgi:hypothetical protein